MAKVPASKKDILKSHISSPVLALTGIITVPAFLLQQNCVFQIIQTITFFMITLVSGKKIRALPPLIMFMSILLLNLFTPIGRVLVSIGSISITAGAIRLGIMKALTLIGLLYLSRGTVRSDLVLPGRFGAVITKTFYYFEQIHEQWEHIPKQPIIPRLDSLISRIYTEQGPRAFENGSAPKKKRTTFRGIVIISLFLSVHWLLFVLQYLVSIDFIQIV